MGKRAIILKDVLHTCGFGQRVCNHPHRCTARVQTWAKELSSSEMYCSCGDLGRVCNHPQRYTARVQTSAKEQSSSKMYCTRADLDKEHAIIPKDLLHACGLAWTKSNHPQRCTARVRTWAKSIQSHPQKMYCARVALSKEYAIILKDALHPYDLRQRAIVLKDVLHACERGQRVCNHPQRCTACVRTSEYTCTGTCLVEG